VHIKVAGDTTYEANETLTVSLSNPSGATLAHGTATGTILNDDAPPSVSISNASFTEGSTASPGHGSFTVSLSSASGLPVTVHYATQDGTAVAGKDYVGQSGTLTFAPGQTQQTIQVAGTGDTLAATESFNVVLSSPSGATIAQGIGAGTIQAAPPTLSINNTTAVEGGSSSGGALSGLLSTVGNQIVNSAGQPVEIAGVNWFGLESSNMSPDGLWARSYKDMMNQMVQLGFNTIRLPFSSEMLHSTAVASGINYSLNPDLQGLTGLQVMDKIVQYADQIGVKIILDHHRSEAGAGTSDNGLWYDAQYSQAQWVSDWQMLAQRYANDASVIGADLHNEPYNGTWGDGGVNDWVKASEQAGNAIGQVNPNWLIFVEGIGTYNSQSYWWGGNLMGVKDHPVALNVPNKLVYSAHDYPNSVYPQPWFQAANYPAGPVHANVGLHLSAEHCPRVGWRVWHQAGGSQGRPVAEGAHRLHGRRLQQQWHLGPCARQQRYQLDLLVVESQLGRHRWHPGRRLDDGEHRFPMPPYRSSNCMAQAWQCTPWCLLASFVARGLRSMRRCSL
jgi:hypothetical protein